MAASPPAPWDFLLYLIYVLRQSTFFLLHKIFMAKIDKANFVKATEKKNVEREYHVFLFDRPICVQSRDRRKVLARLAFIIGHYPDTHHTI